MDKKSTKDHEPKIAPGDDEALKEDASKEEIERGDYTEVITLSLDEVDPS